MPPDKPGRELALELRDVSKFFGDLPALKGIHLRIQPGDSVLLYGPNGAGKTTLLRVLATLARPSEGQVLFGGEEVRLNPAPAKAAIGFASHATFLYGELTARENLKFTGRLFGLRPLDRKVEAALDLFRLRERGNVKVRELSRGLQQRVALARAFLHDPQFLLLDEPFTGLDAETARSLQLLLEELPETGKAVVFSSHDFEQGRAMARRLVALEGGQMRYDGPLSLAPLDALRIAGEAQRIPRA
jgi:heme ABC exporter ATP-binding subunit CcmA